MQRTKAVHCAAMETFCAYINIIFAFTKKVVQCYWLLQFGFHFLASSQLNSQANSMPHLIIINNDGPIRNHLGIFSTLRYNSELITSHPHPSSNLGKEAQLNMPRAALSVFSREILVVPFHSRHHTALGLSQMH